jgi:hypothetical protein
MRKGWQGALHHLAMNQLRFALEVHGEILLGRYEDLSRRHPGAE